MLTDQKIAQMLDEAERESDLTMSNLIPGKYAVITIDSDFVMGVYDGQDADEAIKNCLADAGIMPDTEEWHKHAPDLYAESVYQTPNVTLYDQDGKPCAGIEGDEYGLTIRAFDWADDVYECLPACEYVPQLLKMYKTYCEYRDEDPGDDVAYSKSLEDNLDTIRHALEVFGVTATEGNE